MHTLGRLLLIVISSLALAITAAMIGLGWERILFHTGWLSQKFVMPVVILCLILFFGFTISRMGSTAKAAGVMLFTSVFGIFFLTGFTQIDNAVNHAMSYPLLDIFRMRTLIVEEENLNIIAVLGAVVYPIFWLLFIFPSMALVRRFSR